MPWGGGGPSPIKVPLGLPGGNGSREASWVRPKPGSYFRKGPMCQGGCKPKCPIMVTVPIRTPFWLKHPPGTQTCFEVATDIAMISAGMVGACCGRRRRHCRRRRGLDDALQDSSVTVGRGEDADADDDDDGGLGCSTVCARVPVKSPPGSGAPSKGSVLGPRGVCASRIALGAPEDHAMSNTE